MKLKIAEWLNKRHPDWCWAELVWWAYYSKSIRIPKSVKTQACKGSDMPYCGKCGAQ